VLQEALCQPFKEQRWTTKEMKIMFKKYYIEVQAVKITRDNFQQLKELDTADGVLDGGDIDDFIGDWFATGDNGYQVIPGNIELRKG